MVETNAAQATGRLLLYDTDYVDSANRGTLLYASPDPVMTVLQGDAVWKYSTSVMATSMSSLRVR